MQKSHPTNALKLPKIADMLERVEKIEAANPMARIDFAEPIETINLAKLRLYGAIVLHEEKLKRNRKKTNAD